MKDYYVKEADKAKTVSQYDRVTVKFQSDAGQSRWVTLDDQAFEEIRDVLTRMGDRKQFCLL